MTVESHPQEAQSCHGGGAVWVRREPALGGAVGWGLSVRGPGLSFRPLLPPKNISTLVLTSFCSSPSPLGPICPSAMLEGGSIVRWEDFRLEVRWNRDNC